MEEIKKLDFPSGFGGDICKYFYNQSSRPSNEISIVGGLALLSAVCSNRYTIQGTGLNQYYMIFAPTGAGVDSIYNGFDRLAKEIPKLRDHFGDNYNLNIMKNLDKSFIAMSQETLTVIKRISSKNSSEYDMKVLNDLLDLYKDSKYNLLGECNPHEVFDESIIKNGVLSRFLIVRCEDRGNLNSKNFEFNSFFLERIRDLINSDVHSKVEISADVNDFLQTIDRQHTDYINSSESITASHILNRCYLKTLKIAGLLAVANDFINPKVVLQDLIWANDIVMQDANYLINKFNKKGSN